MNIPNDMEIKLRNISDLSQCTDENYQDITSLRSSVVESMYCTEKGFQDYPYHQKENLKTEMEWNFEKIKTSKDNYTRNSNQIMESIKCMQASHDQDQQLVTICINKNVKECSLGFVEFEKGYKVASHSSASRTRKNSLKINVLESIILEDRQERPTTDGSSQGGKGTVENGGSGGHASLPVVSSEQNSGSFWGISGYGNGGNGGSGRDGGDDDLQKKDGSGTGTSIRQSEEEQKKMKLYHGILTWLFLNTENLPAECDEQLMFHLSACLHKKLEPHHLNCDVCIAIKDQLQKAFLLSGSLNNALCYKGIYMLSKHSRQCLDRCPVIFQCLCDGQNLNSVRMIHSAYDEQPELQNLVRLIGSGLRNLLLFDAGPSVDDYNSVGEHDEHPGESVEVYTHGDEKICEGSMDTSDDDDYSDSYSSSVNEDSDNASIGMPSFDNLNIPTSSNSHGESSLEQAGQSLSRPSTSSRLCMSEVFTKPSNFSVEYDNSFQWMSAQYTKRANGSVNYGTSRDLRGLVCVWSLYSEKLRREGSANLGMLPVTGIILEGARTIITLVCGNYTQDLDWTIVSEGLGENCCIGAGAFGNCFACIDCITKQTLCIKKIHLSKFDANEILVWIKLDHECIVKFYGAMLVDDYIYIFQELIKGPTLKERISSDIPISLFEALGLLKQLLNLLKYLKSKKIIHNDIKAENLMLRTESGELVLIDYGVSTIGDFVSIDAHPTGTQTHWSPEKAASEGYDCGADLWASICVFSHLLSRSVPWISRYPNAACLHWIIHTMSPPVQDMPSGLPEEVRDLILRGWTVDPTKRPCVEQLLEHSAFSLLDLRNNATYGSMECYSNGAQEVPYFDLEEGEQLLAELYHSESRGDVKPPTGADAVQGASVSQCEERKTAKAPVMGEISTTSPMGSLQQNVEFEDDDHLISWDDFGLELSSYGQVLCLSTVKRDLLISLFLNQDLKQRQRVSDTFRDHSASSVPPEHKSSLAGGNSANDAISSGGSLAAVGDGVLSIFIGPVDAAHAISSTVVPSEMQPSDVRNAYGSMGARPKYSSCYATYDPVLSRIPVCVAEAELTDDDAAEDEEK